MKKIILLAVVIFSFLSTNLKANATDINTVKETIVKQAMELNVDPAIALSIAKTESNFRHEARSRYGAVGVYQLMPTTAQRMGFNPYNLVDNIKGGITYYKMMYNMFGTVELALAAYNAGPGNVKKYNNTIPPFTETKNFVTKITADIERQKLTPDPSVTSVQKSLDAQKEVAELDKTIAQVEDAEIHSFEDLNIQILDKGEFDYELNLEDMTI
ncbi:MAG: lytic transglycosylase domain-containing protein [Candidatus Gastranaerophilales bacterium]